MLMAVAVGALAALGFGHFPGRRSDADAVYSQAGALVMTGLLPPADPLPKDPHLYAWGHLFPPA
jgi:hypothetical protein